MNNDQSVTKSFTTHLKRSLARALDFARDFGHEEITDMHLLYGLASEKGSLSSEMLTKANFPVDLLKQELVRKFHTPYLPETRIPQLNDSVVKILTKSVRTAQLYEHTYVGTEHVLACLLNLMDASLSDLFRSWQIDFTSLQRQVMTVLKSTSKFPDLTESLRHLQAMQEDSPEDISEFPILESLGEEITDPDYIAACSPLVGRTEELARVEQILNRRYKNNPLLIGKPGVGKTAIVEGLAMNIVSGNCPPKLMNKRIFAIEPSSLVAGTMYRGEFEQRMKALVEELKDNPDIILFIDEIHNIVGAGSTGQPLDAANILKPALARGEIRCIGATTFNEFQKHMSADQALARRFQSVTVKEPGREETRAILHGIKKSFEDFHQVIITKDAVETAVDLSDKFLSHTHWPDKAIDLIDEASAKRKTERRPHPHEEKKQRLKKRVNNLQKEKIEYLNTDQYEEAIGLHKKLESLLEELKNLADVKQKRMRITHNDIRRAVSTRTGIAEDRLKIGAEPIANKLLINLKKSIIGQDKALTTLSRSLQRGYSLLKEPGKPLGAYLFLGPSGVGKTSTAKTLARELFGDEKALIRLDMSEFGEKFTISKLIGAPAGYVGYQDSGMLTNAVRQNPLSVILFDEIEKAHPDLFNILLQILDEGILRDGKGEEVDFRHNIIVMTSNLGLKELQHKVGFESEQKHAESMKTEISGAVRDFLRLEILNRLDEIIYFEPLGISERQAIIKSKLDSLNERLNHHISLTISQKALEHIASRAYNEEQGVRSLEKIIRDQVEIPISDSIWKYKKGTDLTLDVEGEKVVLK